ncbi:MAG: hypothetical protein ACI4XL_08605 [Bacillus sp. (in: firmicutes)]
MGERHEDYCPACASRDSHEEHRHAYHSESSSVNDCPICHSESSADRSFYYEGDLIRHNSGSLKIEHDGYVFTIPYKDIHKVTYRNDPAAFSYTSRKCWHKYSNQHCDRSEASISRFVCIKGKWRREDQSPCSDQQTLSALDQLDRLHGFAIKVFLKNDESY